MALSPSANQTVRQPRFATLDGLRGVAAVSVALMHGKMWLPAHLFYRAYLAVDFFFMLSGFVIAYAYEANLVSGALSFRRFALIRAIRLYPIVAVR